MAYDEDVADRIREALSGEPTVREKMAAAIGNGDSFMVRCDPDRTDELLERDGATWGIMRDKKMSKGWIIVETSRLKSDEEFTFLINEALAYNLQPEGKSPTGRPTRKSGKLARRAVAVWCTSRSSTSRTAR